MFSFSFLFTPKLIFFAYLHAYFFFASAGARIFSNSWSQMFTSSGNGYTLQARSIDVFMRSHPDSLIIFAAGNNGESGPHSVMSPGTNKNGLTVGASLNSRNSFKHFEGNSGDPLTVYREDNVAFFSSQGPVSDGRFVKIITA